MQPAQALMIIVPDGAEIEVEAHVLNRVRDRKQALGPGLSVQAEIKTGQRRVIQYLLSPIMQALDEAGRER
ncbi:hypothetical protein JQ634_11705 [Bradyrhizobium sp. AUGA SZCCT0240]|nr:MULTISPECIES: hypothetical protein [unclassified Bradyrhizobium]MBR1194597.1 hypothetical protein [Bradyrhizobium sp. AUGA SZCCT0158]MBR1241175.1 hypothetical protein [Bradyrhizobium sp. AUGA SZCCT0274]MBR1254371.1 hypothetical protein [Bradyrhizobium sp. AUGA SZCCT0240]